MLLDSAYSAYITVVVFSVYSLSGTALRVAEFEGPFSIQRHKKIVFRASRDCMDGDIPQWQKLRRLKKRSMWDHELFDHRRVICFNYCTAVSNESSNPSMLQDLSCLSALRRTCNHSSRQNSRQNTLLTVRLTGFVPLFFFTF